MHLIHLLCTNACYSFCTNSNCRNLCCVGLLARSVKSLCCLKCFTWSIISVMRGEIVRIISVPVSSNSRGREKHRVFHFQSRHPQLHLRHIEPHVEHQVAIQMVACGRFGPLSPPVSRHLSLLACSGEPLRGKPW